MSRAGGLGGGAVDPDADENLYKDLIEAGINYTREANFVLDTSFDLLMDTLGITLSYAIARLTIWR